MQQRSASLSRRGRILVKTDKENRKTNKEKKVRNGHTHLLYLLVVDKTQRPALGPPAVCPLCRQTCSPFSFDFFFGKRARFAISSSLFTLSAAASGARHTFGFSRRIPKRIAVQIVSGSGLRFAVRFLEWRPDC